MLERSEASQGGEHWPRFLGNYCVLPEPISCPALYSSALFGYHRVMSARLTFLGAAHTVTGSRYLIEANGARVLVDCGLYQERQFRERDWAPFPVPPHSINAVLLTHAHLDHSGLLPKLARDGFHGRIYCTAATKEIAELILLDSAGLQVEDAEFKRKRHQREGRRAAFPEVPLYDTGDAKSCLPLFRPVSYGRPIEIASGIEVTFFDAGHTLGSAMLQVKITEGGKSITVIFSGDIGREGKPILMDPTTFKEADYVVMESTYGDTVLDSAEQMVPKLAESVNRTARAGGNILIPSFALERAQEILYYLNRLLIENNIPHLVVFLDSPMAVSITEIFEHHHELLDEETMDLIHKGESPFDFPGLHLVRTVEESKAINHIKGTAVIISGSGMCTGGRIKHHLAANIARPDSAVLFVGYQAAGTLGREIVEGARQVRILGQNYPVEAKVEYLHGFSGHADQRQLLAWLFSLTKPPKHVFITHGEAKVADDFARLVREKSGWDATAADYREEAVLD